MSMLHMASLSYSRIVLHKFFRVLGLLGKGNGVLQNSDNLIDWACMYFDHSYTLAVLTSKLRSIPNLKSIKFLSFNFKKNKSRLRKNNLYLPNVFLWRFVLFVFLVFHKLKDTSLIPALQIKIPPLQIKN